MPIDFTKLAVEDIATQAMVAQAEQKQTYLELFQVMLRGFSPEDVTQAALKAQQRGMHVAVPLRQDEDLSQTYAPTVQNKGVTVIAVDGSQAVSDPHAAYPYYLLNAGAFIMPPTGNVQTLTAPYMFFNGGGNRVGWSMIGVERDILEMTTAADLAEACSVTNKTLCMMDQRLLYWPAEAGNELTTAVGRWLWQMERIRRTGAMLAGYIVRSGKASVVHLINTLAQFPDDVPLIDMGLFNLLLRMPYERSIVFREVSPPNETYRKDNPLHEICFFYMNAGGSIARVDIPRWIADNDEAVEAVHCALTEQNRYLGGYPYALTRADEEAVIPKDEQQQVEELLALVMSQRGVSGEISPKYQTKIWARYDRVRHIT